MGVKIKQVLQFTACGNPEGGALTAELEGKLRSTVQVS